MQDVITAWLTAMVLACLSVFIGPLIGGVFGWVFALIFDESFATLQRLLRVDASGFQMGAALGFVAGFLRTKVSAA